MTLLVPQRGPVTRSAPSELTKVFWDGCAEGTLLFQRCEGCRSPQFQPIARCRSCMGTELRWEASAGRGAVTSWTVVWRPALPSLTVPYAPAVVELDEGYHIMTNVVGCDHRALVTGLRVVVVFHADAAGFVLPYFEPDPASHATESVLSM